MKILQVGVWLGGARSKNWEGRLAELLSKEGHSVTFVPYPAFPKPVDCDVVFASHTMAVPLGYWLSKRFGKPFVAMVLDFPFFRWEEPWKSRLRLYGIDFEQYRREWDEIIDCLKKADVVIAISKTTAEQFGEFGIDCEVCYLGVDKEVADACLRRRVSKREQFCSIFNFNDHKRPELIADVFNRLGYRLVMMGDGRLYEQVRERARPNVLLPGAVTEEVKYTVMQRSLALVHASVWEGFFIPGAEALYSGTPVIAYELPVLKEVYGNNLYYWHDEEEFVEQIEYVREHRPVVDRQYVLRKKLTLQDTAKRISRLLLEAIS